MHIAYILQLLLTDVPQDVSSVNTVQRCIILILVGAGEGD